MVGLFSFLLVASGVALVVALVLLAVRAVKKKPKKPVAIAAAVCAAVLLVSFVGVGVTYNPTPEQIAERERIAAEKAAAKEAEERAAAEEAARREAEKAAQSESPASAPAESQPSEPSASVPASAPSETPAKPETSAPAESQKPVQSEPPTENTPSAPSNSGDGDAGSEPEGDFILDFNSLTPDDFGTLDTGNLELESGELLEVRYGGDVYAGKGVIIVKAKTSPNLTNKLTIRQNYHDVCELITNHGFDSCPEIQYWAVADMTDGEEGKAISFTLDSDTILGVANQTILPINLDDYLQDLWILPSLLR